MSDEQNEVDDEREDDIIQIIPATGWFYEFENKSGKWHVPLVAWGLTRGGLVCAIEYDDKGIACPTFGHLSSNCNGIFHETELKQQQEPETDKNQ